MKISVKVITNSNQNEVVEDYVDLLGVRILKAKVNQPPENGKANKALIKLLSEYFKVRRNAVLIIFGATSRNKIVEIKTS